MTPALCGVSQDDLPPLFMLDVSISDDVPEKKTVCFARSPESYGEAIIECLQQALKTLQAITLVERRCMKTLYWKQNPTVKAVSVEEDWVQSTIAEIQAYLKKSYAPVMKYLSSYKAYVNFIRIDIDEHLQTLSESYDLEQGGDEEVMRMVEDVTAQVESHTADIEALKADIPDVVSINMFRIDCAAIKAQLIAKHREMKRRLLSVLANANNAACNVLLGQFGEIMEKLDGTVDDIEGLTDMAEFIKTVPDLVEDIWRKASTIAEKYELLDELKYQVCVAPPSLVHTCGKRPLSIAQAEQRTTAALRSRN